MSTKNFVSYGDAETLMSGIKSAIDDAGGGGENGEFIANSHQCNRGVKCHDLYRKFSVLYNSNFSYLDGRKVWTDGSSIFGYDNGTMKEFNRATKQWISSTISFTNIPSSFNPEYLWTHPDGTIYYSYGSTQLIYNKATHSFVTNNEWVSKSINNNIYGDRVWKDGNTVYYSHGSDLPQYHHQYVLNGNEWNVVEWIISNTNILSGTNIWSDLDGDIYLSGGTKSEGQFKLNRNTNTWESIQFTANTIDIWGHRIFSYDGNIYYTDGSSYIGKFDKNLNSWVDAKEDFGYDASHVDALTIWSDGEYLYNPYSIIIPTTRGTVTNI